MDGIEMQTYTAQQGAIDSDVSPPTPTSESDESAQRNNPSQERESTENGNMNAPVRPSPDKAKYTQAPRLKYNCTSLLDPRGSFWSYEGVKCIGELKWVHFKDPHPIQDLARWDGATRGPWGSLLLICKHPFNVLTVLGATLTILSLAIDPFAQQVLGTNNYTRGDVQYALGTPSVDGPMTAALYSVFFNPPDNASSLIPAHCPSGNCTRSEPTCKTGARAFNVSLSPCVHRYGNVTYTGGIFNETIMSTAIFLYVTLGYFSLAINHPSIPSLDCSPADEPSLQKTQPATPLTDRIHYYNNHSAQDYNDTETVYFDKACTYDFGY
ncbi:Acid phosphatase protein [Apiospora phragmitis]|uniref:Acid phosphatase protein n=1 Tax=Apiospora phragmitis TaxID=2905665 RepID=A0ABR1VQL9_9PEZI